MTESTERLSAALADRYTILQRLGEGGPYHLGDRFSLVDLSLACWTASFDSDAALETRPAIKHCVELVSARPKLRDWFAELALWKDEYAKLQARGAGVR